MQGDHREPRHWLNLSQTRRPAYQALSRNPQRQRPECQQDLSPTTPECRQPQHVLQPLPSVQAHADATARYLYEQTETLARPRYADGKYTSQDGSQPCFRCVPDPIQGSIARL